MDTITDKISILSSPKVKKISVQYVFFSLLQKYFQKKYTIEQSNNLISGLHATVAIVLSNTSINHLKWFSSAYFLFDTIQTLKRGNLDLLQYAYLYHHLSSIYLLACDSDEIPLDQIFFWGELSNIINYPLYHYLHKTGDHKKKIKILKLLQKIMFAGIRLPLCTKKIITFALTTNNPQHLYALFPNYIMGILWSIKILSQ